MLANGESDNDVFVAYIFILLMKNIIKVFVPFTVVKLYFIKPMSGADSCY